VRHYKYHFNVMKCHIISQFGAGLAFGLEEICVMKL
jgi:hypothetical protein